MDGSPPVSESQIQQQAQQQSAGSSGGPQIRSRITVVCAECKRLKLKCDRRNPCGSCTKRDTVARCIYSAAAAEKVDLHSLNNRLIQVESQVAQITAPGARPYPSATAFGPSSQLDRPILAVGSSGSSLAITLDDISAIWLDELDLNKETLPTPSSSGASHTSPSQIKLEQLPVSLPVSDLSNGPELPLPLLLPPLSAYYASPTPSVHEQPSVTLRIVQQLPFAQRKRQRLYDNVEDVLKMRPSFNLKHFKDRTENMFRWASEAEGTNALDSTSGSQNSSRPSTSAGLSTSHKAETARAIFFGPPPDPPPSSRSMPPVRPTLSFFALVAAAFALGTMVDRETADENDLHAHDINGHNDKMTVDDSSSSGRPSTRKRMELPVVVTKKTKGVSKDIASCPAVLYALSQQALGLFERSNCYDLDYLAAMIMHVLYVLHDGKTRVAHNLLPDVGKMVNIARTMGLDVDPDEYPGKFNVFEAEMRRRMWWDIYYYDLIISDFMGRSPLISDHEFTTHIPMDVDEEVFTSACNTMPLLRSPLSPLEPNPTDFRYFGLKCRLAQLVKTVKGKSSKDAPSHDSSPSDQLSVEQAASSENEVKQWLADLPAAFRLDLDTVLANIPSGSSDHAENSNSYPHDATSASPVLVAQRCELAITANRLILKIYLPFLRPSYSQGSSASHYQATIGTISAAHVIIRASNVLFSMWKQRPDLKGRRPSPGLFDFYSFGRTLFDAAVVCAHNAIKQPTSMWQRIAMEDVNTALEIMRDPLVVTGRGSMRGGVEGGVNEAVRVVALMIKKAEAARSGNHELSTTGMKRKHDEVESDADQLSTGFHIPFVGGAVVSNGTCAPSIAVSISQPSHTFNDPSSATIAKSVNVEHIIGSQKRISSDASNAGSIKRNSSVAIEKSKEKEKDKDKHSKKGYPAFGVRIRPDKDSPWIRGRTTPSAISEYAPDVDAKIHNPSVASALSQPPSHASTPSADLQSYRRQSLSQDSLSPYSVPSLTTASPIDGRGSFGTTKEQHVHQSAGDQGVRASSRFSLAEVNQCPTDPQKYTNLTPPQNASMFEQSQSFENPTLSQYNGAPANGSGGHYASTAPQYGLSSTSRYTTAPHDPRATPSYRESPSQAYYPYNAPYTHPIETEGIVSMGNVGTNVAADMDNNVPREEMYGYPIHKSSTVVYNVESSDHRPFPELQSLGQTPQQWSADGSMTQTDNTFWQYNQYAQ
ncbi:hypothetical protein BJ138DRAFT_1082778 [Hygrophoropsis aurantiaca]|uniref:Uncharacterized protein n=1 Tax=Hygrophoropsis aurantiaca TaxID=72124 RepID=A0ACB8AIT8_9AGAM|nr:hypothetical protein BJ138DRAFT_1082778 [Hygrophoropsis aurantiaca]